MRFKAIDATESRQRLLRSFVIESFLIYGVGSVVCLFLLGRTSAIWAIPPAFADLLSPLRGSSQGGDGWSSAFKGMMIGMIASIAVVPTVFTILTVRAGEEQSEVADRAVKRQNYDALLPQNASERRWTTLLALNAGLSEELFFRVAVPLVMLMQGASALLAVIAATFWFARAHLYQGWRGILATFAVGGVLMLIYLHTGSLWLAIAIHAILDLNQMTIAPGLRQRRVERLRMRSS